MRHNREIPPDTYDEGYYFSEAIEGYEAFKEGRLSHLRAKHLDMLRLEEGVELLEIGFARGDLMRACAEAGARITGVDYSECACDIASQTLAGFANVDIRLADCRALPLDADTFDRVFAADVIEHLSFDDGVKMLSEMWRVLKPGGFMLVHTTPNAVFRKFVYPLGRPVLRMVQGDIVAAMDAQFAIMDRVHVDEYSLFSLKRAARLAHLPHAEAWIDKDLLRASEHRLTQDVAGHWLVRLIAAQGGSWVVRFFFGNDLYLKCAK